MTKTNLLACAGLLLCPAFSLSCRQAERPSSAAVGAPAPAFQLSEVGGKVVSLSQYKGQVVLLNFWATWCGSCQEEMPALEDLYHRYRGRGFALLAPSADGDGRKAILPFLARSGTTFPVLLADERTLRSYEVRGLPTSFLIDVRGNVARRYVGPIELKALENDILKALQRRDS